MDLNCTPSKTNFAIYYTKRMVVFQQSWTCTSSKLMCISTCMDLQKACIQASVKAYVLNDIRPSSIKFWLIQQRCPTQAIHYDGTREFLQEMYIQDKAFRLNA